MENKSTFITGHQCPQCAQLRQAILSFTGVIRNASDPEIKKAAQQLYRNVKRGKINNEN